MGNGASMKELEIPSGIAKNDSIANVIDTNTVINRSSNFDNELKCIPKIGDDKILINKAIKKMFMFQQLDRNQIKKLIDSFSPVLCTAGEVVIQEGDHGEFM